MKLRADHPPIYAARRASVMPIAAHLMLVIAMGLVMLPLVMTLLVAR